MRKITFLLLALLIQFSMSMKAEVVFEGVHEVGSWNAKQLPVASYPVLAKAGLGDVIAVTIEDSSDGRITLQDMSWSGFADEYNCANGVHYFVLSESDATSVAANGLIVTGENYTLTKVELLYKNNLWEGTVNDNTGWKQSELLDNSLFSNLTEGSLLGMSISAINDGESWHQFALRADYTNMLGKSASEAGTYLFTLTAENASDLKEKNIDITAQYLCVSALTTYTDTKEDAETIWEGTEAIDETWTTYKALTYDDRAGLANARMTDIIRITLTTTAENAQIQLSNPNKGWNKYSDEAGADLTYSNAAQTFEYTISSAAVLEDIQLTGIIITGKNYNLTKVELVKPEGRYDAAAITIGEDGIATYSSSKNLDLSGTGLKAYYASEINTGIVTLTPVTTIWGYQGYIIRGKAGIYEASVTDNATYPSTNYLKATSDYNATVTASTQNTFHYIFAKDETKGVGFYRLSTDKTLAAHKAYLETSIDITPAEGTRLALVFEGEATGISDTTRPNQVSGSESHCIYDLQGRRVQNPSKGIYIIRGKKVVMK